MTKTSKFFFNGFLITAVSLLIRSVSVSFSVYLSNKIGAVAMGLFTLISTVYGFAITVATSGIGLATMRLVAEAGGTNEPSNTERASSAVRCIVRKCVVYALCFSIGSAVILFLFAPLIGEQLLADARTVMPLRILAFTLPPIALSSVFNGYFTAIRQAYKNSVIQMIGQFIKIYACILLLSALCANNVESACLAIVLGGAISEILSFFMQYFLYLIRKHEKSKSSSADGKKIEKKILHTALPVAFSAYVRSGLITIEHMLIPWGLERNGNSREHSLAAYGTVHSMVFPLVLFPSALSGSFASLLVPEIAESNAMGDRERIDRIINKVFHAVLIFSIGTAGILMCFSFDLARAIYPQTDAGRYILMIAPLIPVMYLDTSVDALLKGLGEQVYCMGVNIVDSFLSVILVWMLLPNLGIVGYIITVYFTEIINATLSITRLLTVTKTKPHVWNWLVKPLFCIIVATGMMRLLLTCFVGQMDASWTVYAHIVLTVILYLLLLLLTKTIRLPKGKKV
ncbi:MAG: hypothetical protein E7668_00660 [Ruminococcaceae bacterium]|nr:hypothetical protein [Oscillospiraceae bacterium]